MKKTILGLAVAISTVTPTMAADLMECGCTLSSDVQALVRAARGTVYVSRDSGFTPTQAGDRFAPPARVLVGPKSSSVIDLDTHCRISLEAGQSLEWDGKPGRWCPFVADGAGLPSSAPVAAAPSFTVSPGPLALVGSIAAGAVVISIARGDDRVSR